MELKINGQLVTVPDTIFTIEDLIHHFKLKNRTIMVEQNHTILRREEHEKATVENGDTIELVQFVGGG
ncbi:MULTISPECIES: sulfur carrier protein ThiS [Bacillaceae]|uniref:sulfur carrier protein ThiS n=1 Tax=Bacillaceae TaxID=186817 RepID=UPI001C58ABB8|nr:sulfur carrier protein ThiS [Rossellomorea sp. YZS02]MBW3114482.1 sulfur carrier protein ThiS [Bacillus sp. MCCB 382]MDX8344399.1 sulfur carrier protein ThiS [Rossellomorea sp. YZS02]